MDKIIEYWNNQPCNIKHSIKEIGTKEYFDEVENKKYFVEPHILDFVNFSNWNNKKVLEIGCGIGTDCCNFIRNNSFYTGIELSNISLNITKLRLNVFNLTGKLILENAENNLNYLGLNTYDLIYSFGVIHHSQCPDKIINNCYNLLKKGGTLKIMLYAKNSWKKILIDNNLEQYEAQASCPLAYTYTNEQVYDLLKDFDSIKIEQKHIFPYKIKEYKNGVYIKEDYFDKMPDHLFKVFENNFGWHLCITAIK